MILTLALAAQAICFLFDEFYFHFRRGLPRWERIGHPIDTASVLVCLAIPLLLEPSTIAVRVYAGASVFSCVLVTKDEWVHARECDGAENWLHSLLFMLHPVVFAVVGWHWILGFSPLTRMGVSLQAAAVSFFALYQIIYWNFIRGRK